MVSKRYDDQKADFPKRKVKKRGKKFQRDPGQPYIGEQTTKLDLCADLDPRTG